jgi:rfaE bifunctional protein nucleotidyltransferase chain/domain
MSFDLSENAKEFLKQNSSKKIVFTNGCFDILHAGHVSYLNEAKAQGDLLVVGLNSDSSVKGLKGESRPINSEAERKFVLENLKAVDLVEIFQQETPLELIKAITPQMLVKGGDWSVDQIVGSEVVIASGGEVKSLQFVDGFSTTGTIEKILSN